MQQAHQKEALRSKETQEGKSQNKQAKKTFEQSYKENTEKILSASGLDEQEQNELRTLFDHKLFKQSVNAEIKRQEQNMEALSNFLHRAIDQKDSLLSQITQRKKQEKSLKIKMRALERKKHDPKILEPLDVAAKIQLQKQIDQRINELTRSVNRLNKDKLSIDLKPEEEPEEMPAEAVLPISNKRTEMQNFGEWFTGQASKDHAQAIHTLMENSHDVSYPEDESLADQLDKIEEPPELPVDILHAEKQKEEKTRQLAEIEKINKGLGNNIGGIKFEMSIDEKGAFLMELPNAKSNIELGNNFELAKAAIKHAKEFAKSVDGKLIDHLDDVQEDAGRFIQRNEAYAKQMDSDTETITAMMTAFEKLPYKKRKELGLDNLSWDDIISPQKPTFFKRVFGNPKKEQQKIFETLYSLKEI